MQKDIQNKVKICLKNLSDKSYKTEKELSDDIDKIITDNTTDGVKIVIDGRLIKNYLIQYTHYMKKTNVYKINIKKKRSDDNNFVLLLVGTKKIDNIIDNTNSNIDDTNNNTNMIDNTNDVDVDQNMNTIYEYPKEKQINYKISFDEKYGPFGTQSVYDVQIDDEVTPLMLENTIKFDSLREIISPPQRSKEWFAQRETAITASDGASALGLSSYDPFHSFLFKKMGIVPFEGNQFCYHGTKYEQIATMIYERRKNVHVEDFGLMKHPKYDFIAASPDGICSPYKFDGIHLTKHVGTMLEIKCPATRNIHKDGGECPKHYWMQVQQQLECCDLDDCDFWQCVIEEYKSREEFLDDTDPEEPFKSKEFGLEKGCIIQLLPKSKMNDTINGKYKETVYEHSKWLYPPSIAMTPYELDKWTAEMVSSELVKNPKYYDYFVDKIYYWKLKDSKCTLIKRDKQWFADNIKKFEKVWNMISFFKNNIDKLSLLYSYVENMDFKSSKKISMVLNQIYDTTNPEYDSIIDDIKNNIADMIDVQDIIDKNKKGSTDDKQNQSNNVNNNYVKKSFSQSTYKKKNTFDFDTYMF